MYRGPLLLTFFHWHVACQYDPLSGFGDISDKCILISKQNFPQLINHGLNCRCVSWIFQCPQSPSSHWYCIPKNRSTTLFNIYGHAVPCSERGLISIRLTKRWWSCSRKTFTFPRRNYTVVILVAKYTKKISLNT